MGTSFRLQSVSETDVRHARDRHRTCGLPHHQARRSATRARPVIEGLLDDALTLVPLGPAEAWRAAEIRARHYHRTRCPISLADAVLIASAGASRTVASADRHVLAVAASEGIATTQLPDSRGRRPRV